MRSVILTAFFIGATHAFGKYGGNTAGTGGGLAGILGSVLGGGAGNMLGGGCGGYGCGGGSAGCGGYGCGPSGGSGGNTGGRRTMTIHTSSGTSGIGGNIPVGIPNINIPVGVPTGSVGCSGSSGYSCGQSAGSGSSKTFSFHTSGSSSGISGHTPVGTHIINIPSGNHASGLAGLAGLAGSGKGGCAGYGCTSGTGSGSSKTIIINSGGNPGTMTGGIAGNIPNSGIHTTSNMAVKSSKRGASSGFAYRFFKYASKSGSRSASVGCCGDKMVDGYAGGVVSDNNIGVATDSGNLGGGVMGNNNIGGGEIGTTGGEAISGGGVMDTIGGGAISGGGVMDTIGGGAISGGGVMDTIGGGAISGGGIDDRFTGGFGGSDQGTGGKQKKTY